MPDSVQLAKMDLDANKNIGGQYRINSYPTLIYFKRGNPIKFGGSRNKEFMTFWLNKKIQPPIIPLDSNDQLVDLETNGHVNIVYYGDITSPKASILTKIAAQDDYNSITLII
jgi:thioredoxin-like negative regulator of GroEL